MPPNPTVETKEAFEAKAKANGWVCTRCGKAITGEDQVAYKESRRCNRCHHEIDPDSGRVPAM